MSRFVWVGIVLLALVGADWLIHRHAYFSIEATPGFYPVLALIVSLAVGLLGRLLAPLLRQHDDGLEEED
ncbi:hypothetical protein OAS86_03770 [Gammaproteobacteria bacterium]|nr:hypothetical protein [Gammaproteobacteria bacterium]